MFIAYRLDENKSNSATFALLSGNVYLGAADNSLQVKYSIPARWIRPAIWYFLISKNVWKMAPLKNPMGFYWQFLFKVFQKFT